MPVELEAPPAPASPPPPAAPPASPAPVSESFEHAFPDDGLDTPPEPTPPPAPSTPPPGTPPAKPPAAPAKPPAKAPEGETTPPAAPAKGDDEFAPPAAGTFKDVRSWAHRMGTRAQKAETELQKLQARITQLEGQPPKRSEDAANLAQQLATAEKRIEKYESDLRLSKYERSQHYADTYQKPYKDAVATAYRDVKELLVTEGDPDDPDTAKERPGTQADFDEIYSLPLGQATKLAKQKFGDAASIVLGHRSQIRRLAEAAYQAVEEYKTKGGEAETQTKAQQAQQEQAMERLFRAVTESHAKRTPDLFAERDGDKEGNELLNKGRQFAAAVFGGNEGLTPQQIAIRDGMAYNRLAAYPRVLRDLKKAKADLAEANKTIEGIRGSGPGAPPPAGGKVEAGGYVPVEKAFDEIPE